MRKRLFIICKCYHEVTVRLNLIHYMDYLSIGVAVLIGATAIALGISAFRGFSALSSTQPIDIDNSSPTQPLRTDASRPVLSRSMRLGLGIFGIALMLVGTIGTFLEINDPSHISGFSFSHVISIGVIGAALAIAMFMPRKSVSNQDINTEK
jgi:hypothetical protein